MNSDVINIYAQNENLIPFMKLFQRGITYNFHSLESPPDLEANNIFILKDFPKEILKNAKYILLSDKPWAFDAEQLEALYSVWPLTLTPPLIKFFFERLQAQLQVEIQNSSAEQQHQKRLVEMAHQDYLTGLATRWYLQEYFQSSKGKRKLTCIYLDLDNFKAVNDTFGHQAGDRALAATAEMIQEEFADGFAARMGGDEFIIVLPGAKSIDEVVKKVNTFMKNLLDYYQSTKTMKALSVSVGISQKLDSDKTIDVMIQESDQALYAAKKAGKNCCKIYGS